MDIFCILVFDVVDCEFMGRRASMSITSVTGHMMGLEFDSRFKSWQGVNPEELFTAEVSTVVECILCWCDL